MSLLGEAPARAHLQGVARVPDLELDLDVFHGPFDLLVTLIVREEVDLWEVEVSRIIAEYILRLSDSDEFDLEATSQFIVLIAALLEMKSRLLLADDLFAGEDEDDLGEEAGEELLVALVRYTQFKRAAAALAERYARHAGRLYRQAPPPSVPAAEPQHTLPAGTLVAALAPLLREPPVPDVSHITDLAVALVRELQRLRTFLGPGQPFTFAAVAPREKVGKAVTFFALLELHSRGEVRLTQTHPFADIVVTPLGRQATLKLEEPVRQGAAAGTGGT